MKNSFLAFMSLVLFAPNSFSQSWQMMAKFEPNFVNYIYSDSNALYLSGRFIEINNQPFWGLAEYSGNQFHNFSCGIDWDCITPYTVGGLGVYGNAIMPFNNKIYATGNFNKIGNINTNNFGEWDGQNWTSGGIGIPNGYGAVFKIIENELYLCGTFDSAFGIAANSFIKFDGQNWSDVYNIPEFSPVGNENYASSIVKYKGKIYAGGQFYSGFGINDVNAIAVYNDTNWVKVGTGIPNPNDAISDMVVYKNELIVGGHFTKQTHPQNPGNNIAAWDGTNWHSLGDASQGFGVNGVNASVVRMIVHGDYLYVCGHFSEAGGETATNIARWDGTNWCALATGFASATTNEAITSIAFFGDTLFAVGPFNQYNGDTTIRFAAKLPNPDSWVTNCTTVGIQDFSNQNNFQISPNPTNQTLNIKTKTNYTHTNVFDLQGRIIMKQFFEPNLDVGNLKNGMYILELSNQTQKARQRFIKN